MKLLLRTVLLLCAIVVFVKGDHFSGEVEDNEDELSELVAWDLEDPAIGPTGPPTNLGMAFEYLMECFMKKHKGVMKNDCIKEFKRKLPDDFKPERKMALANCAINRFKECQKHDDDVQKPMKCMLAFNECVTKVENEGSSA
ncbi:hypothetical protein OS493_038269 [Desmophyllum pertusum]|uniref:Uncharacterized protein n=1 Tax=Desmophyllum pertusum TaxID=174260 RepID=A0A9X0CIX0_9CNID|nr:hypothetical protein OS493_038269 [Desmophyllum pertusum]